MKKLKRALSVVLCIIMIFGTMTAGLDGISSLFAVNAEAAYSGTLKENSDGSFRILQISDIQDSGYLSAKALATIRLSIRKYNPNLIVLTGDNFIKCSGEDIWKASVDSLVAEFVNASGNSIPFAVTYGNHDYEANYTLVDESAHISLKTQNDYYLSKGAVALNQTDLNTSSVPTTGRDNSATLYGTGYIDIKDSSGTNTVRRVILLNTGSLDNTSSNTRYARVGNNVETKVEDSYANVVAAVNTWTSNSSIKCIGFQHIAMQEFYLGDTPATSLVTHPISGNTLTTHEPHDQINNGSITGQYVTSVKNPTLTGEYYESPKASYNSTKELYKAYAKSNVLGVFYGHDHTNTISGSTTITYDGTAYTLTQGFGGGIDVYDGEYDGYDPHGSCYIIDKSGNLLKENFYYTQLLTEGVTYPTNTAGIKYISEVALFNGLSFDEACDNARAAGYIPVTRAFSEGFNFADLNSNDRNTRYFTGNGSHYECIAYKQTSNPAEAITDLRVYQTSTANYAQTHQSITYTLEGKTSDYYVVSGCGGNVNYGVDTNTSYNFLYYSKNANAGSPLTELIVEVEESSSDYAYRTIDYRNLQTGNFAETFGQKVGSAKRAVMANLNIDHVTDTVVGDSVFLFLKRYDGCSGYNTKYSYEVSVGVPETIVLNSSSNFATYSNNTVSANGVVTLDSSTSSSGKVYFYCPDATGVTVSATSGDGSHAVTLSSCTISNATMTSQGGGLFHTAVTAGKTSGTNGVIKWVFSYNVAGAATAKTQIAYSTVLPSGTATNAYVDKSGIRGFIDNFNQSVFVSSATDTYNGENNFAKKFADLCYARGNTAASQTNTDDALDTFEAYADKTSPLYVPQQADAATQALLNKFGGFAYGVCQATTDYSTQIGEIGFNWVRVDVPCPYAYDSNNNKLVLKSSYTQALAKYKHFHDLGYKVVAVTPYPKDIAWDMMGKANPVVGDISTAAEWQTFWEYSDMVIRKVYSDLVTAGTVDALQITNEIGLSQFTVPLTFEQAAYFIRRQLKTIHDLEAENNYTEAQKIALGFNMADYTVSTVQLCKYLMNSASGASATYTPTAVTGNAISLYCDYVAIDIYTGNQGETTAKIYSKKIKDLNALTGKPVILMEFGYLSEGGIKSATEKKALLSQFTDADGNPYTTEAEAIADATQFISQLPDAFKLTLTRNHEGATDAEKAALVFSRYGSHFYGQTAATSINDIKHSPDGQGEYYDYVMRELKTVECLAGTMVYTIKDSNNCFICGFDYCPYETKYGLFNVDGTAKASTARIASTLQDLKDQDAQEALEASSSRTVYNQSASTTVTVIHQTSSGTVLSRDTGTVFKGSTVIASTKNIPGYTCSTSIQGYTNVSSAVSKTFNGYTATQYTATLVQESGTTSDTFKVSGDSLTLPTPTKAGYNFAGWKVTAVAGSTLTTTNFKVGSLYPAGSYDGMYGNVTLEATWTAPSYTVTFNVNGGSALSFGSKTVTNGEAYGNLPTVTAPSGKSFAGWNTASDGSGTVITADTICNLSGNQTLYAYYSSTSYYISYDNLFNLEKWKTGTNPSNSTSVTNATISYDLPNNSFTLVATGDDGYTSQNISKYSMPVEGGKTYTFSADISSSLSSGWVNIDIIVFPSTGGNTSIVTNDTNYVDAQHSRTITGTYTAPSGATSVTIRFGVKTTGKTVTYRNIRFVESSAYNSSDYYINYPVNFSTALENSAFGDLPVPSRPGYTFDGWYSNLGLTNRVTSQSKVTGDTVLYSKWVQTNEYTYDNLFSITEYGASKSPNLNKYFGRAKVDYNAGSITIPGDPTGSDSPYAVWNVDSGYYTIPVTAGTKYYLSFYDNNWGGNVFVKFDSGTPTDTNMAKSSGYIGGNLSGNSAQSYTFYFVAPSGATKIGLRFGASGTQSRTYSNIKLVDEAHYYSDAVYSSTYDIVKSNQACGELQTPSRSGYRFDGWYTNSSYSGSPITSTTNSGTSNLKLYSKWSKVYDVMYNSIFDFDQWAQGLASTSWSGTDNSGNKKSASATVDYASNSITFITNADHMASEANTGFNGANAYKMPVIAGHTYKISADITADANNSDEKTYDMFVFEWPETYSDVWGGFLSTKSEHNQFFNISPGTTQTCTIEFTARDNAKTISLRLGTKSQGAAKGTFSNVRIQDITSASYPEAFVQTVTTSDSLATLPTREGYTADGWYDTINSDGTVGGTKYTSLSSLTANKTLYAKYNVQSYTITYKNPSDNSTYTTRTLAYGADPTTAYTPSAVTGYTFAGWYSDTTLRTYAPTSVRGATTLYAKWEPNTYNVGYDNLFLMKSMSSFVSKTSTSGSVYDVVTIDKNNDTVTMQYLNSAGTEKNICSEFIELPETAGSDTYYILSADYTAKFCTARIMTFFYDSNGTALSTADTDTSGTRIEVSSNCNGHEYGFKNTSNAFGYYVMKVPSGCKKVMLRFDCKADDSNLAKKRTAEFSNIRFVEKTTNTYNALTANYSMVSGTVKYQNSYTMLPTVSNPGYVFEGWYSDKGCTTPIGTSTTIGNQTIYSKWKATSVTVNLKLDGANWTNCSKSDIRLYQKINDVPTLKATLNPLDSSHKYTFTGTKIPVGTYDIYAGSGTGDYADTGFDLTIDESTGVGTAEINYYTLTVTAGDGIQSVSGSGIYLNGTYVPVSATSKTGYNEPTFDTILSNGNYIINGTKTIIASATLRNYSIIYQNAAANNGLTPITSSWPDNASYTINSPATIPSASASGYTFGGWKVISETAESWTKNATVAAGTSLTNKRGDVTLAPIWTANGNTAYRVEHYVMTTDGTYSGTPTATDNLQGTTGATLTLANLKKSTLLVTNGIVYKEGKVGSAVATTTTIAADGSRVIKLYYERKSYKLTISASNVTGANVAVNGNMFESGSTVFYGSEITLGNLTPAVGYSNATWSGLTATSGKYYMPTSAVTLTASASPSSGIVYKVEHYQMDIGGSSYTLAETDSLTGTTGASVTATSKTYTGFTYDSSNSNNVKTGTVAGNGSLVLKLYYTRNQKTVTLASGTGVTSVSGAGTYYYGQSVTINAQVKTGYTWSKWTNTSDGTQVTTTQNYTFTMGNANVSYTANATANDIAYTVEHYKMNINGSGYSKEETQNLSGKTDSSVNIASVKKSYTGFTYSSYTTNNTDTSNTGIKVDGSLVIKIYYTRNQRTVAVASGTGITSVSGAGTYYYGQSVTISAEVTTGYTWSKWTNTSSGAQFTTTKDYTFTMGDANVSYTANATPNTDISYKVEHYQQNIYDNNYTLFETDNLQGTTNSTATATAKTYTGFTYKSNATGTVSSGTIAADGSLVLKLYYTRNQRTLTINSTGAGINSVSGAGTYKYGQKVTVGATLKTGYQNLNWNNASVVNNSITMPDSNVTLTPTATAISYTITYKNNVPTSSISQTVSGTSSLTKSYTIASTATIKGVTRTGYNFNGWKVDYTSGSWTKDATISTGTSLTNKYGNVTLVAQWTAKTTTVTLNGNSATTAGTASVTATYDSDMPTIAKAPQRAYTVTYKYGNGDADTSDTATYTFNGYYSAASGGTQYYDSTLASDYVWDKTATTDTMYAQWTANSVELPEEPIRDGYTFRGWTLTSGTVSETLTNSKYAKSATICTPTSNVVLTAQWTTDSTFTVTNGACTNGTVSVGSTTSYAVGSTVTVTPTPESASYGYSMVYYQIAGSDEKHEIELGVNGYTFEMPAEDITVGADFVAKPEYISTAKYSCSLILNDNIDIVLNVKNCDYADLSFIKVYVSDGTNKKTVSKKNGSADRFVVASVAPEDMKNNYSVTVVYDGVTVKTFEYSVARYCTSVFKNYASTTAVYKLCCATLYYGECAQKYARPSDKIYVTKDFTNIPTYGNVIGNISSDTNYTELSMTSGSSITGASARLTLESTTAITIYLTTNDTYSIRDFDIKNSLDQYVDNANVTFKKTSTGYELKIAEISANQLSRTYTITTPEDENFKLVYSPYCYMKVANDDKDSGAELKNLLNAMYIYSLAAQEYSAS